MKVLSIRRITNDRRHNAFTGARWFKGDLFVAYRQGNDHNGRDWQGRIVVLRSRDAGITWDTVAVLRAEADTRDASLYTDGSRLYAVAAEEHSNEKIRSGGAVTEDGDQWTSWQPYEGTGAFVLWRPVWYDGKHYCAGFNTSGTKGVHWFESEDGRRWEDVRIIHESEVEDPNECYLEILPDGTATMLMRCDGLQKHPYLCRSQYPFTSWNMQQLQDIRMTGPALWTVDDRTYICARWDPMDPSLEFEEDCVAHTGIFRVVDDKTYLICVLPSGPHPDHSYMGVARWPDNRHRFSLSFYSNVIANDDPAIDQWTNPDIYVADVLFGADFIDEMLVSDLVETDRGLEAATLPDPEAGDLDFRPVHIPELGPPAAVGQNFIDAETIIAGRAGLVYFLKDIDVGPWDHVHVHLGYDGPVKVWWNGTEVFSGPGTSPAKQDTTSLHLKSMHGMNHLVVALDTRDGEARGIFARCERAWGAKAEA